MKRTTIYRPLSMEEPQEDVLSQRLGTPREDGTWIPRVRMYFKEGIYHIDAELPGVAKRDISVYLGGRMLTISGRKAFPQGPGDYLIDEIIFGSFHRSVVMPENVDYNSAKLALFHGMLSIVLKPISGSAGK